MAGQAATSAAYVFLSYASADRERALHVADALQAAGVPSWLDQQAIAGGSSWGSEIVEGIKGCAALLILCSNAAMQSRNVKQEIQLAWRFERAYVPVLLEPVEFPEHVLYFLEGWQWVEILDQPQQVWLPVLLKALARLGVAGPSEAPAESAGAVPVEDASAVAIDGDSTTSPAQSLSLERVFAGREAELEVLRRRFNQTVAGSGGLVTVAGEPGIGKTRIVRSSPSMPALPAPRCSGAVATRATGRRPTGRG
jgi:hypothetical protein